MGHSEDYFEYNESIDKTLTGDSSTMSDVQNDDVISSSVLHSVTTAGASAKSGGKKDTRAIDTHSLNSL